METSGPTSGISASLATATRGSAGQWQVGQLLQATVTDSRTGTVLLAIGNRQFTAETSLPLEKGQRLALQVRSLGERPVLQLTTSTNQSPINTAIRLLLPKQGPLPPLLATMGQLARNPDASIPPIINELIRSSIKQLAGRGSVATPRGLKNAISASGIFLEGHLLRHTKQTQSPLTISPDFKANLLRLLQLLRQWPASRGQTRPQLPPSSAATSSGASPTATTPASGAPPTPDTAGSRETGAPTPDQFQRTVQTDLSGKLTTTAPVSGSTIRTTVGTADIGGTPASGAPAGALAPPLRGSIPSAQPTAQINLELLSRTTDIATHLLQQAEAALARMQLHQLAAVPREGERGLLEWLFELPVRRGDDIDLWAMRVFAEQRQQKQQTRQRPPSWSAQLAFDLPGLGPVQVEVQLMGDQVSTRFWAEHPQTLPLLREHMHELRHGLSKAGLQVGELECQPGPRPAARPTAKRTLISERV